jgi:predicted Zn-ribbon and HTH transcriptional regulator
LASPAVLAEEPRRYEVADVLRDHAHGLRLTAPQARAVRDIVACRTERLGGHLEVCPDCGFSRGSYNSCRNRHCPKCQILKQALWAEAQEALLLPTPYFQIVFTLPPQLHAFFRRAPAVCLTLLFEAVAETLADVARTKLKATIGFTLVLHTWNQRLGFHLHLHCVVPAGGLSLDASHWIPTSRRFFLPVKRLRKLFRAKLLAKLERALRTGQILGQLDQDLFLQHVLPPRFVRIRHYGLLAARRRHNLARCRELLAAPPTTPPEKDANWVLAFERLFGTNPLRCPACKTGVLVATRVLPPLRA